MAIKDYKDKYYYQINFELIKKFIDNKYKGKDFEYRTMPENKGIAKFFNGIFIDGIYINPDKDEKVVKEWIKQLNSSKMDSEQFKIKDDKVIHSKNNSNIYLSLDGQCDWKCLYNLYNDNYEWLEKYNAIRSSVYGQLLWPSHKKPTIDTERYKKFNNRIDYTLFDIKNYFNCVKKNETKEQISEKCVLCPAYLNKKTSEWLVSFDDFNDFIDTMKLNIFVKKIDEEYKIIDLEKSNIENEKYIFIEDYKKNYNITTVYIDNLIELIKDYPLCNIKGKIN